MDFTALYEQERARELAKAGLKKPVHSRHSSHPVLVLGPLVPEKAKKKKSRSGKSDLKASGSKSDSPKTHSLGGRQRPATPPNHREGFFREWTCSSPKKSQTLRIKQNSSIGHGGLVWDCSLVLAKFLETGFPPKFWKGKNVLELGAGTGLVGLATAVLGAAKVVLSDLEEITPLLEENVEINKSIIKKCEVNVVDFCWGSTDPRVLMTDHRRASWRQRKETFLRRISISQRSHGDLVTLGSMDLRNSLRRSVNSTHARSKSLVKPFSPEHDGKKYFDVIVASDVAYDPTAFEPLREVLNDLCGPETIVLLSHEWRQTQNENLFFRTLKPEFLCEMVPVSDINPDYRADDISIFKIRRLAL